MRPSAASLTRVVGMFQRYVFLHRRSLVRSFDVFFWPVMDLLVWGFLAVYIQQEALGPLAGLIVFLIGAMIGWDLHYRGQQAVTISLMEEIWTRNVVNVLIAPIRVWEWIAASFLYGTLKVCVVTLVLAVLAQGLYAFELGRLGWAFLPLAGCLLWFGWAGGLLTAGLLVRFGYAAEALILGIPFLIQPYSCVFYPLSTLPTWASLIARWLPTTYVFEALREILAGRPVPWTLWVPAVGLNVLFITAGAACFVVMLHRARLAGSLGRLGQD